MPVYRYEAIDEQGALCHGVLRSLDAMDLTQRLQQRQLQIVQCRRQVFWSDRGVDTETQLQFYAQLSQLLHAGIPLLQCLQDLTNSETHTRFRLALTEMSQQIESGGSLSVAMSTSALVFSPMEIAIVQAGEASGQLAESLQHVYEAMAWQKSIAARLQKAVAYPLFSGLVLLAASVFLLVYLVPQLTAFLQSSGEALPWYTQALIRVSDHLGSYGLLYLAIAACLGLGMSLLHRRHAGFRFWLSAAILRVCCLGPVVKHVKLARFAYFSALMYRAGITVITAFETSQAVVSNPALEAVVSRIVSQVRGGKGIAQSFADAGVFPVYVTRMVSVGEATGRLDDALMQVSHHYKQAADKAITRLEQVLGPALIMLVGALLAWVILAVIGPMYSSIASLGL
ncbi:MAG TPA: hypothetical protein DD979_08690 [Gammaproteobacteria bacterium]|jgi:type IV pilus assembly protein PilC|nr:hypothetical protein [Gammaproteobacteria bacterium]